MSQESEKKNHERVVIISKLLALNLVKDVKSKQEQVRLLDVAGLSPNEIADLLEMKVGTVHVTLFNIRKARKAKLGR
jgi:DNA-directed RNA polymerase specialized sigma24 family protein